MTTADSAEAMVNLLSYIYDSPLEDRWQIVYESPSGTLSVTQGSPEITWTGGSFDEYLGDIWVAFGSSGFTPTKFYKIEGVHSATAARLEHFVTETTASGRYFVLAYPKRQTIQFEPGNYNWENYPDYSCDTSACVSLVGVSNDAQIMWNNAAGVFVGAMIRLESPSGELSVKRLGIYCTANDADFRAQQPFRVQAGPDAINNFLMERCYIQSPHTDFFAGQGAGTVILRNNHGIVGVDGICGLNTPDKVFIHSNYLRSPIDHHDTPHGKSGCAILTNVKAATFGTREVFIHGNHFEITDDGSEAPGIIGISIKVSTAVPGTPANVVSKHNHIIIDSQNSGTESATANFAAGIYCWDEATAGASSAPVVESHGDVIELRGSGANTYGYKANSGRINIWNRPDSHPVRKEDGGTIYDDGTPL